MAGVAQLVVRRPHGCLAFMLTLDLIQVMYCVAFIVDWAKLLIAKCHRIKVVMLPIMAVSNRQRSIWMQQLPQCPSTVFGRSFINGR